MTLMEFLDASYTAYHAVDNIRDMLLEEGFQELFLGEQWNFKSGKYFVTRNGSSVIAFVVSDDDEQKELHIAVSHTDSPCFKIKGERLVENEGLCRLNTEKYGGGLLYSYFDRPMKVAGRLLADGYDGVQQMLVASDYNVVIPSLAIHLNRDSNEKPLLKLQTDLLPLYAQDETELYKYFTDKRVLDADLYVTPATPAFLAGVHNEFLCSPRIDNLTSVYSSVCALIKADGNFPSINLIACLDNEEIGSGTRQGAPSFLSEVLDALAEALDMSPTEMLCAKEQGLVLSVDNGHAVHPAHPEKHDPKYHCVLNGGIVIKHHVNYATDGLTSALVKHLLEWADLPYQDLYNNSELSGGSTLGLVTARQLGMRVCDIGLSQLAMHSACETVGADDPDTMQKMLKFFFESPLCRVEGTK